MKRIWMRVALGNLLIATAIGALLRYAFVGEVKWLDFRNFMHAHSHVAMLGWIYLALYCLLISRFIVLDRSRKRFYSWLFWITQAIVMGMLISFPIQGYGPLSIAFSATHIICSYVFAARFMKDMTPGAGFAGKLVKTGLLFMIISTLGIWSMGPLIMAGLKHSELYYMAVQFFLHFQFNGWFLFTVIGLFFSLIQSRGIFPEVKWQRIFYILLFASCLLTYALAVAWSRPLVSVFIANGLGVVLQLLAFLAFLKIILPHHHLILGIFTGIEKTFIKLAFYSIAAKILIQASVAVPFIAKAAYTIRNYIIGFIHLLLLGIVTFSIFGFALNQGLFSSNGKTVKPGLKSILAGFIISELILFLQGTMLWMKMGFLPYYYEALFVVSLLIPIGVFLFLSGQWRRSRDGISGF